MWARWGGKRKGWRERTKGFGRALTLNDDSNSVGKTDRVVWGVSWKQKWSKSGEELVSMRLVPAYR